MDYCERAYQRKVSIILRFAPVVINCIHQVVFSCKQNDKNKNILFIDKDILVTTFSSDGSGVYHPVCRSEIRLIAPLL